LHFSVAGLQWVPSAYLLTYGGFMLLGGRLADLVGRRRILITGIAVIGISSLAGGLAQSSGVLIGARLALLAAFVINELRHSNPLAPLSIFRITAPEPAHA